MNISIVVNFDNRGTGVLMPATGTRQAEAEQINESTGAFSDSEAQQLFELTARRYLDMSADEFLRMWDAKTFVSQEQQARAFRVAALIPLIRHIRAGKKAR